MNRPSRYRKYSAKDQAKALVQLRINSELDNPITATSSQLEVPYSTIFAWSQGRHLRAEAKEIFNTEKSRLAELYDEISILAGLRQLQILEDDTRCAGEKLRDLSVTAATATDKSRLLRGEATTISQSLAPEQVKSRILELVAGKEGVYEAQEEAK